MKTVLLSVALLVAGMENALAHTTPATWNRLVVWRIAPRQTHGQWQKFDPNKLTAASWFYPLGAKVQVILISPGKPARTVLVTITDRGPAKDLVHNGRIIDLAHAAFKHLGNPDRGLVPVIVHRVK